MKIALIGYGRMGRLIEEIAKARGHEIVAVIDVDNRADMASEAFRSADVAIEFSVPSAAPDNIRACFEAGVPVVCGTTGFNDRLAEFKRICDAGEGTLLHSSNFSIGVNIFRAINRYVAGIMNSFPAYTPALAESHHIHKLDHPSGTAVTLADELVAAYEKAPGWYEPTLESRDPEWLPVSTERRGEVPGIHTVTWESEADTISFTHSAKNRRGFAEGAVRAAEWLAGKKGFFSMGQMLSDITGTRNLFT
ncbi:MAG: 4-hydroxy-tetrahydrodipicolinate reductase [Muribaculaceae bacterium]|nr:4-hydroxy-tetrahydrodipicolinate reductase [Muribaculaceae bacterium]